MSVILKSNVAYTGTKRLKSIIPTITTPQAYFDEYKARVSADGGEIVNSAKTLGTIEFLFNNGLMSRSNSIVSTYYGIKREGAKVVKLYAIDGKDLVGKCWGTGQLSEIDTDGSLKSFSVNNDRINGCLYQTESAVRVAGQYKVALITVPVLSSGTLPLNSSAIMGYADGATSGQIKAYGVLSISAGKAVIETPAPVSYSSGTTAQLELGKLPLIAWYDSKLGKREVIQGDTAIYTNLFTFDPATSAVKSNLQVGGVYYDKEGTANDGSFAMNKIYSAWAMFDFTEPELYLISTHLQSMH